MAIFTVPDHPAKAGHACNHSSVRTVHAQRRLRAMDIPETLYQSPAFAPVISSGSNVSLDILATSICWKEFVCGQGSVALQLARSDQGF